MNVGIIGAGWIAGVMAKTIYKMHDAKVYAVASRSKEKADEFAKTFHVEKSFGSYEEMLQDKNVDLVYIATPHSHHAEQIKLCIKYKKPVLCEKAFTMNAHQAREVIELAKSENVFLTEAIWTRFMPSRKIIDDLVKSGIVGNVNTLTANLSYSMANKERLVKPELAGGALLDVGVYGLNFASMHFGTEIEKIESSVKLLPTGVDEKESITIFFKNGNVAFVSAGMNCRSDRKGIFWGDKGYIVVENINNPNLICAFDSNDKLLKKIKVPKQITGYEYEVIESMKMIESGKVESESMPFSETIFVMEKMDELRKSWGVVYPGEA